MRTAFLLHDATSTPAGALDTGILDVSSFDSVSVYIQAAGAAAAAAATVRIIDDNGASLGAISAPPGIGNTAAFHFANTAGAAAAMIFGPVPRRIQAVATGGAASTVRIIVYGYHRP